MAFKPRVPYYRIRQSKIHGRGAFATRPIRKGARIAEYTGELIPADEADNREMDGRKKRHHTFMFQICGGDVCIDAGAGGGNAKWINHSCDPNCEAIEEEGHVYIYALRPIARGEELSYNYQLTGEGLKKGNWRNQYRCLCGSDNCSGNLLVRPRKKRRKKK